MRSVEEREDEPPEDELDDTLTIRRSLDRMHLPYDGEKMIITIERERDTPTPGKSPRYRARIRAVPDGPAILISASNFGSVASAKSGMDDFFGRPLTWIDSAGEGEARAAAEVLLP